LTGLIFDLYQAHYFFLFFLVLPGKNF
jgi:hypothetical protein